MWPNKGSVVPPVVVTFIVWDTAIAIEAGIEGPVSIVKIMVLPLAQDTPAMNSITTIVPGCQKFGGNQHTPAEAPVEVALLSIDLPVVNVLYNVPAVLIDASVWPNDCCDTSYTSS
jgi:hypothetical protein